MGILNFILCEGGKILDIVDTDETSRCLFKELPEEIAKEYVEIILEGFPVKSIEVIAPNTYNEKPSAIV